MEKDLPKISIKRRELSTFFFKGYAGSGQEPLDPAAKIAVVFIGSFVDKSGIAKKLQPTLGFSAFFSGDFELGEHIGGALRKLRF